MKQFIKKKQWINIAKSVLFLVLCFSLVWTLSVWMQPKSTEEIGKMKDGSAQLMQYEPPESMDAVAVGNSNLWASFSPMELWGRYGYTAYNCGSTGQQIWQSYQFLKKAFHTQSPGVVFLETDMLFQNGQDVTFNTKADAVIEAEMGTAFPVLTYHDRWKNPKALLKDRWEQAIQNPFKGYNYKTTLKPFDESAVSAASQAKKESLSIVVKLCLSRIVALCQSRQVKLVLFTAPCATSWTKGQQQAVAAYAAERQLPYIDFNEMKETLGLDWNTDTRDAGTHLNHSGAQKLTAYLGNYLNQLQIFTDHRSDPSYSSWKDAYSQYQQQTSQASN